MRAMSFDERSKSEEASFSPREYSSLEVLRSTQSFYCYNLEEKIIDLTGPIERRAKTIRCLLPVNWQPYLNSKFINQEEYDFITDFQKTKTSYERETLFRKYKLDAYKIFLKVVQQVHTVEDIQKVLIIIDDMLWEDLSRVYQFKEAKDEPWRAFMDLLHCGDEFVRNLASRIITKLFDVRGYIAPESDIKTFLTWLKNELRNDNDYILCVARCLQELLRIDEYRLLFLQLNGIFRIIRILCSGIKPQAQYQFVFCIWIASYNVQIAEKLNMFSTIEVLVELLESCPSEIVKLPRVIFATFRNLLEKPRESGVKRRNALLMIQCKLLKIVFILKLRAKNFGDQELIQDLDWLEEKLNKYVAELSTFDEYILEVRSGRLEWSIVHTSKPFWDENADRLNENDYEILKALISLLSISKETKVLCVAAHDLGEYMSRYLRGRMLVEKFGGKEALLELLKSNDPGVKYHALKSLQILMLNNFDLLVDFVSGVKKSLLYPPKNADFKAA